MKKKITKSEIKKVTTGKLKTPKVKVSKSKYAKRTKGNKLVSPVSAHDTVTKEYLDVINSDSAPYVSALVTGSNVVTQDKITNSNNALVFPKCNIRYLQIGLMAALVAAIIFSVVVL